MNPAGRRRCLIALGKLGAGTLVASSSPAGAAEAKATADVNWARLGASHWIASGVDTAPRKVYLFTDPNCPFCNRVWSDARPWVESGKVQLRHVMVGILSSTSPAKAAALLDSPDPVAALDAYERSVQVAATKTIDSGKPQAIEAGELFARGPAPRAQWDVLQSNAALMTAFGIRATPGEVWRDVKGRVQVMEALPREALAIVFGPR
jgi:thiol:disulfide interchange protein DsbG